MTRLLVDANLLVLWVVGSVNRNRIDTFKRTRKYTKRDYDLLVQVLSSVKSLYTVAHILAEVSNLTDLAGSEGLMARRILKETISLLKEPEIPSARAAEDVIHEDLGLSDAAIAAVARAHKCAVLTDDLDLFRWLSRDKIEVFYFTYLRAREFGL